MKLSIIGPVKNESQFIGYSIMALLPYVHEFIYSCAKSNDGTDELLEHIKEKYAGDKLIILRKPEYDFDVKDTVLYDKSFNDCVDMATGDIVAFIHPDMIVTNPEKIQDINASGLAWWTNLRSFAGDMKTEIVKGRATRWKNIHKKMFGLHYFGAYGSQNEDFYFRDITGKSYRHYGENFNAYPYKVSNSGLNVFHYCENKPYSRRFEKMKSCLKTLFPTLSEHAISEMAASHPRVTLEGSGTDIFGNFEFKKTDVEVPPVFDKYKDEFDSVIGRKLVSV